MAEPIYNYVIPQGVIVPDVEEIQNQVIEEFKNTFGQDLITTPDTPQGMLITAETLARQSVATNNATIANQINPNLSGGVYLDAILSLLGSERNPEEFSTVSCNLAGVPGAIIPAGAQARQSSTGEIFESLESRTLNASGAESVIFRALNSGAIDVPTSSIDSIVTEVLGWDTVTNPDAGTLGSETQSDESAKILRNVTLAAQGTALPEAIISALYLLDGVKSVSFRENISPSTQVIDGVTMIGHSIYVCVDGGSDNDIANTLLNKKSAGAAYNNGPGTHVSVTLIVPFSGQSMIILFDRPEEVLFYVNVIAKVGTSITDPATSIKNAILSYQNGEIPGEQGLVVGQSISSFELAGAINIQNPGIYVKDLEISLDGLTYSSAEIPIGVFEKAVTFVGNISVTVVT